MGLRCPCKVMIIPSIFKKKILLLGFGNSLLLKLEILIIKDYLYVLSPAHFMILSSSLCLAGY